MALATDVKIFWCDPGMTSIGAMLSGTAGRGSLTAIFDACLVNGYGLKTADTVTVAGGIATVNISTGHEYGQWQVVLVAGATPAGLNGEKRVLTRTTNTITFDAAGIPDGAATGTITVKVAPLGWLKPFTGTNKAVYKIDTAAYPEASNQYLRVDDSAGTLTANVALYETMTDVDTGTNKVPTVGQAAGYFLNRSDTGGTGTLRYWVLIGDARGFYFLPHYYNSSLTQPGYGAPVLFFGDPITPNEADPYKFLITATHESDSYTLAGNMSMAAFNGVVAYARRARGANRVTQSQAIRVHGRISNLGNSGEDVAGGFPFPNLQDGAVQLSRTHIFESGGDGAYLGRLPGALFVENRIGTKIHASRLARIFDASAPAFPGRVIGYFLFGISTGGAVGVVAFDIVGPWR